MLCEVLPPHMYHPGKELEQEMKRGSSFKWLINGRPGVLTFNFQIWVQTSYVSTDTWWGNMN